MNAFVDFVPWFAAESLRADGSNFIEWYRRMMDMLALNGMLYVIREPPLGDEHIDFTGEDVDDSV